MSSSHGAGYWGTPRGYTHERQTMGDDDDITANHIQEEVWKTNGKNQSS